MEWCQALSQSRRRQRCNGESQYRPIGGSMERRRRRREALEEPREISRRQGQTRRVGRSHRKNGSQSQPFGGFFHPRPGGGAWKTIGVHLPNLHARVPSGRGGDLRQDIQVGVGFRWRRAALRASPGHRQISPPPSGRPAATRRDAIVIASNSPWQPCRRLGCDRAWNQFIRPSHHSSHRHPSHPVPAPWNFLGLTISAHSRYHFFTYFARF
jgi:hypothetical protein